MYYRRISLNKNLSLLFFLPVYLLLSWCCQSPHRALITEENPPVASLHNSSAFTFYHLLSLILSLSLGFPCPALCSPHLHRPTRKAGKCQQLRRVSHFTLWLVRNIIGNNQYAAVSCQSNC